MTGSVALYGHWSPFPVAIASLPAVAVATPKAPPALGRNTDMAFGIEPIDEIRLAEVNSFLRSIGFAVQNIVITREIEDFAKVHIEFAQTRDPRVPRAVPA